MWSTHLLTFGGDEDDGVHSLLVCFCMPITCYFCVLFKLFSIGEQCNVQPYDEYLYQEYVLLMSLCGKCRGKHSSH